MSRVVCFGEIMGRLNPEGYLKIAQANSFNISFAGAEANVAVSLANFNVDTAFVTRLPNNDLSKSVLRTLRGYNVDVSNIILGDGRLGLYFVEKGASQRPSKVIYDRQHSAIAKAKQSDFDWDIIFDGADWFHFTGITPALSTSAAEICLEACKNAKKRRVSVSCDLNYRNNLWTCEQAQSVMSGLMPYVDVCIANEEDAEKVFGIKADKTDVTSGEIDRNGYISVAEQLIERFNFDKVAITLRESISASENNWSAMLYSEGDSHFSSSYHINIVDRIGGGDSFGGALIYAILAEYDMQKTIEFATAASCLKQTIEFDFNQVTIEEVHRLVQGDRSGRVQR